MCRFTKYSSLFLPVFLITFFLQNTLASNNNKINGQVTEKQAVTYLRDLETRYSAECNKVVVARWNYNVNVTSENEQLSMKTTNAFLQFQSSVQEEIFTNYKNWNTFLDEKVRREFQYLSITGPGSMTPDKLEQMNQLLSKMKSSYTTETVCDDQNNCHPEIKEQLCTDSDYDEQAHYWTTWHDTMSRRVTPSKYTQFIQLQNELAKANNFHDMSEMWLAPYNDGSSEWTTSKFQNDILYIWKQLKPIYSKLHAYVRMKLRKNPLNQNKIKKYGYLPAHLFGTGNVLDQNCYNLREITKPFPNIPSLDTTVSAALLKQNYTIQRIYEEANKFFQGLGLPEMSQTFWEKSLFEKPTDGKVCHILTEDFCLGVNSTDFRIKMCTGINMDSLVNVHREMGHIAYFMQYTNEHYIFRDGGNPAFHPSISDALTLSVTTPSHFQCVLGFDLDLSTLCEDSKASAKIVTESDLNFLYTMALQKLPNFPLAITMEKWRWEVFEGKLQEKDYNKRWWELTRENQGISPPSERPLNRFDPSTMYPIVANIPYLKYFISNILQFQFYEAMCIAAGQYNPNDPETKPLYKCDISGDKNAGEILESVLKLGFTKLWPEILKKIIKSPKMSITPLLNYFQPLLKLFDEELAAAGGEYGCFGADCQSVAAEYLKGPYEQNTSKWCNRVAKADWDYNLDLNNVTAEEASNMANLEYSKYLITEWAQTISQFDYQTFDETDLTKRQLTFLNAVGIPALGDKDLEQFNQVLSTMTKIYGNGKICPFDKQNCDIEAEGLSLEPDLEDIIAQSQDYEELVYVWSGWRNVSGKKIRGLYEDYVNLSNKAAKLNGYDNMGDFWLLHYESPTFREEVETLWNTVRPLYEELHAYVRYKLRQTYPQIAAAATLPAHVLGNMWAQSWDNIFSKIVPYEGFPSFDITNVLKEKFTPDLEGLRRMFWTADDFFVSTGLANMSVAYSDKAMIIKPDDGREVICHASAWDMCDGEDYRISMCTNVDTEDFITIHHELGHIQYDLEYRKLPITLREGANPGFHEAIGDVIALSVSNPKHMVKIGFMEETTPSHESTINYLMKMSLDKVAFLPFSYLIDSYRWKIFDGSVGSQNYTYYWLKMRAEYQGIVPPVMRSEQDFDAGSKFHVASDTPYIRYFFSYILQFQLHKVLCEVAGELEKGQLHECDIYKNPEAGLKFKHILQAGASKNWKVLLKEITGNENLDATAILEYFQPLREYLEGQRATHKYPIGWDPNDFKNFYEKTV